MADLKLSGPLNFIGNLRLQASSGGTVKIGELDVLVQVEPTARPAQGIAPPVILPPPPASPTDLGPNVNIINSFNKTVKIGTKPVVTQGIVMEGGLNPTLTLTWPGMVLPSQNNTSPVTANGLPMNVVNDQAVVFPSGATVSLSMSGQ